MRRLRELFDLRGGWRRVGDGDRVAHLVRPEVAPAKNATSKRIRRAARRG